MYDITKRYPKSNKSACSRITILPHSKRRPQSRLFECLSSIPLSPPITPAVISKESPRLAPHLYHQPAFQSDCRKKERFQSTAPHLFPFSFARRKKYIPNLRITFPIPLIKIFYYQMPSILSIRLALKFICILYWFQVIYICRVLTSHTLRHFWRRFSS